MLNFMNALLPVDALSKHIAINQIMKLNEKSAYYGLTLSQADAIELVETRTESLRTNGRIEIGSGVIEKIINAFYESSYIMQEDYSSILHELIETFYYMKNETLDLISDDELIDLMKTYFENTCRGSLELLNHRELETLARNLRYNIKDYSNMEDFEDQPLYEEEEEEF